MKIQKLGILFLVLILVPFISVSPVLASTLSFSPSSGTFNKNCNVSIDVNLDTAGAPIDGVDAYIFFDPAKFTLNSIDTQGKVFSEYPSSSIDSQNVNKILISGVAPQGSPYNGSGKFATINLTVKDTAVTGVTQLTFDFNTNDKSDSKDSNVVRNATSEETLASVTNGSYTIGTGACSGTNNLSTPSNPTVINNGSSGGPNDASDSAFIEQKEEPLPFKTLPQGGTEELTMVVAIAGSLLVVLGILGLTLL